MQIIFTKRLFLFLVPGILHYVFHKNVKMAITEWLMQRVLKQITEKIHKFTFKKERNVSKGSLIVAE